MRRASLKQVIEPLERKAIYEGRVFRVERDLVPLPNGRVVPMEVVRHRGSVVLVPQPARDRVILIRQYRYVIGRWIWELPAGSLDPGEAPLTAARRECEEEIQWTPRRVTRLGMFYATPGFCDEAMTFYRCTELVRPRGEIKQDPDEQIEPRTVSLKEAWAMVNRGDIVDLKTIVGLVLTESTRPASPRARRARTRRDPGGRRQE